jgi:hypothetical protein
MTVLPSGSHTPAGIDAGLDANGVAQRMRAARCSRYRDFCSCHQSKSTNQSSEVKITGDLHAANPRRDEVLVNRDVCSTLRLVSLRVGDRLVDQAPSPSSPNAPAAKPSVWLGRRPFITLPLAVRSHRASPAAKSMGYRSGAVMGIDPP